MLLTGVRLRSIAAGGPQQIRQPPEAPELFPPSYLFVSVVILPGLGKLAPPHPPVIGASLEPYAIRTS